MQVVSTSIVDRYTGGFEELPRAHLVAPGTPFTPVTELACAVCCFAACFCCLCRQVVSSAIVDKYIGESARVIREMFGYAREHQVGTGGPVYDMVVMPFFLHEAVGFMGPGSGV